MTDPTPEQLNSLPPESFWTEERARVAKALTILTTLTTAERREQARCGSVACLQLERTALSPWCLKHLRCVRAALTVLDEEQALLRVEAAQLRAALALAIEAADAYVPPLRDLEAEWGQRYIPPYVRAEHEAHPAAVARRKLELARAALAGVGEEKGSDNAPDA